MYPPACDKMRIHLQIHHSIGALLVRNSTGYLQSHKFTAEGDETEKPKILCLLVWPLVSVTQHEMITVSVRNRVSWFWAPAAQIQFTATPIHPWPSLTMHILYTQKDTLTVVSVASAETQRETEWKKHSAKSEVDWHVSHVSVSPPSSIYARFSHCIIWSHASTICSNASIISLDHQTTSTISGTFGSEDPYIILIIPQIYSKCPLKFLKISQKIHSFPHCMTVSMM